MTADTTELEKMAYNNYKMPEGLDFPEQMLFQALRFLYRNHEFRQIDTETARREKMQLMQSYEQYRFWSDIYSRNAHMTNRLSYYIMDINQNGCECCKKAVAIFTNMDKDPDYILEQVKHVKNDY